MARMRCVARDFDAHCCASKCATTTFELVQVREGPHLLSSSYIIESTHIRICALVRLSYLSRVVHLHKRWVEQGEGGLKVLPLWLSLDHQAGLDVEV